VFPGYAKTQTITVVGKAHADVVLEQARNVTLADACDPREPSSRPCVRGSCSNGVLHAVHDRVDVVAPLQPGRKLRVGPATAQIDDKIARNGDGTGLTDELTDDVQHQVNARCNSGARVAVAVFYV